MQGICKKNSTILSRHPEITGRYEYYTTNPRTFVPDCLCAMYMYQCSHQAVALWDSRKKKLKWRIKTKKMRPLGRRGKLRVKRT